MKKNQERRLHRKNAKLAKEGGTLLALKRTKPDTTVIYFRMNPANHAHASSFSAAAATVAKWDT